MQTGTQAPPQPTHVRYRDRKQIRGLVKIGSAEVVEDLLVIKCSPREATEIIVRLREGLAPNTPVPIYRAGCM